jgi:hypothetical protein
LTHLFGTHVFDFTFFRFVYRPLMLSEHPLVKF